MLKKSLRICLLTLLASLFVACASSIVPAPEDTVPAPEDTVPAPKEEARTDEVHAVVLMIGDGLGPSQITLARYFTFGPTDGRFAFEQMPVTALVSTWSASNAVTDSGAAATAFAAGVKTKNHYVGLDAQGREVITLADHAKNNGWGVGYVTTTTITHATPAAFYSHVENRYRQEGEIPDQLLAHRPDVVLAGGTAHFLPEKDGGKRKDQRDLLAQAEADGWTVWRSASDIAQAKESGGTPPLLALMDSSHLHFTLDLRNEPALEQPNLAEMTRIALATLRKEGKPFFLLVEGGRIDHASHSFDAAGTATEVQAFDEAVRVVLNDVVQHPKTLVVLTADHATGGLAINDDVDWDALKNQKASVARMTQKIRAGELDAEGIQRLTGWPVTEKEIESVRSIDNKYSAERRLGTILSEYHGVTWIRESDVDRKETVGHTGEDVPLFAQGPGSERFQGMLDNTEIPKRIVEVVGWDDE